MRPIFQVMALTVVLAVVSGILLASQSPESGSRSVELSYHFEIKDLPSSPERVTAWIPLPPSDDFQKLEHFKVEGPWDQEIVTDPDYQNRVLKLTLREGNAKTAPSLDGLVVCKVQREAQSGLEDPSPDPKPSRKELEKFLGADRLVPTDGPIAKEARSVAGKESTPLLKARRLYDHIVQTVRYDKSGKGWGKGDAVWACDARSGNCTDFHSLFIGEARALGIPARFAMGIPLPENKREGEISGYHCWAEFHLEGKGWVPVDASEAFKNPGKKEFFFGNLDANRVLFSIGRDIRLPSANSEPLNYFIYPHVEIDGKPHDRVTTRFSFQG